MPEDTVLPEFFRNQIPTLSEAFRSSSFLVFSAPPGTGKTTYFPYLLLQQGLTQTIRIAQPRKIAARSAAYRVAGFFAETVGQTVGYRVRNDSQISNQTKVEYLTTGILLRQFLQDPSLSGVDCLLFDEFHERSAEVDLALAFALRCQSLFRPDLKIVVMSATLEKVDWKVLHPSPQFYHLETQMFPVTTQYLGESDKRLTDRLTDIIPKVFSQSQGDLLVFLPGKFQIQELQRRLEDQKEIQSQCEVFPLHGELPLEQQHKALFRPKSGKRKIVLSTNVAETSVTVENIEVVIDSGKEKVLFYDTQNGFSRLVEKEISKSSAKQRSGRAGRTQKGHVIKMYSETEEARWADSRAPELLRSDLGQTILLTKAWGEDLRDLPLLDRPSQDSVLETMQLLQLLGGLDPQGNITELGKKALRLPLAPRIALAALPLLEDYPAIFVAYCCFLLENPPDKYTVHSELRFDLFDFEKLEKRNHPYFTDISDIHHTLQDFQKSLTNKNSGVSNDLEEGFLRFVLDSFPDRLGKSNESNSFRYKLTNGMGAILEPGSLLEPPEFLVALRIVQKGDNYQIQKFLSLPKDLFFREKKHLFQKKTEIETYGSKEDITFQAKEKLRLGAITLSSSNTSSGTWESFLPIFLDFWKQNGEVLLQKDTAFQDLSQKIQILSRVGVSLPNLSFLHLTETIRDWLPPLLPEPLFPFSTRDLKGKQILEANLSYQDKKTLEENTPSQMALPNGNKVSIHYETGEPYMEVRLQDLFGWKETPKIASGKIPLTLHILSPGYKPVQITKDLAGFWKNTYKEVKKELKGRYPKHHWPESPENEPPYFRPQKRRS